MMVDAMKVLVLMMLVVAVGGGAKRGGQGEDTLCGDCRDLEVLVAKMSGDEIERKAAEHHGKGSIRGAGRVLCGGFCSGTLLGGRWGGAASNLGVVMKEEGLLNLAERCYILASRLDPAGPTHAYRRGNVRMAMQDLETARKAFLRATRLLPGYGDAYNNLGNCLMSMSRFEEAGASYGYAIRANPKEANYYVNMGGISARKNLTAGIQYLEQGLALNPFFPEAYNNLANFKRDVGDLEGAVEAYKNALKLMPDSGDIMVNMASAKAYLCDWRNRKSFLKRIIEVSRKELRDGKKLSLSTFYANIFGVDLELLKKVAEYHSNSAFSSVRYLLPLKPWFTADVREGGIRLGILSSDLTNHIVGHGIAALLPLMQERGATVLCYALSSDDGSHPRRQIEQYSKLTDIRDWSTEAAARHINADKLHVLLDLNGQTKGNRIEILSLRPAAVQVLFHGYAGTSGANFIDLFVADRILVPPEFSGFMTEKLMLFPPAFSFFLVEDYGRLDDREHEEDGEYAARSVGKELGIGPSYFRYASFNSLYKLTPSVFGAWMKILSQVDSSILWLLKFPSSAEKRLRKEAKARGVDDKRLVFTDLYPRAEHLQKKSGASLFLDTLVYNAHSSAADSLASGVPVLSMAGSGIVNRVAASLLICTAERGAELAKGWRRRLVQRRWETKFLDRGGWADRFLSLLRLSVDRKMGGPNDSRAHVIAAR
ncbi:hypothetical protein GUITHDRAFT_108736 [Guillardia theta CCMP2712]|uniref:protein O-GlcNAc transferase n=1 Tax=Guillardia theta (strain CCMP2712) TaxID=905079 RepID=L1JAY1_GUITC|nr:hypothetical protein GUITHDRAFT_108736 [Guillardia theta CCMP2712]EKX45472.1 hypothetical protein GUITHDRAFT_108736 [Guillardia theta CCMP2712]|eukprot:XP_005832452.1 hypothetical protein GUITHDRAFT_108736 [Guillardia theta CCMP2712]